jgi:PAS domain S-box-containing protein
MSWLALAVVAALTASVTLAGVYLYLWLRQNETYLGLWAAAWALSSAHLVVALVLVIGGARPAIQVASELVEPLVALLLLWGTQAFLGRRCSPWWAALAVVAIAWYFGGLLLDASFLVLSLPLKGLSGLALLHAGWVFVMARDLAAAGRYVTGGAMLLWGAHKLDYPLLRAVEWFAPWGFTLSAVLAIVVAVGTLLMYLDRAWSRLRAAEARYRGPLENTHEVVFETDASGRLTFLNAAWTRLSGFTLEESLGRDAVEFLSPADRALGRDVFASLKDRAASERFIEARLADRSGEERCIAIGAWPILGAEGRPVGVSGTVTDLTARKLAERQAARAEARLAQAVDQITDAFALWDADDRLVLWNRTFAGLVPGVTDRLRHGDSYPDVVRRWCETVVRPHTSDLDSFVRKQTAVHRQPEARYEIGLIDGRWIAVRERRMTDGSVAGLYADVTERKRAEVELRRARDQAEMANRAKSDFLANMSHELRTPLNAILGFAQLMGAETFGPLGSPKYREYLQDIYDSGQHLLEVINDILDMAKVEAGRMELNEEAVDVAHTIDQAARIIRPRLVKGNLDLKITAAPALPRLWADERLVRQILLNLLSNAVKYTPKGGRIRVDARLQGGDMVIAVRDSGIGIAPEDIERAMRPFGQIDGPLTRAHSGTGLGLPLSQSLIALHGGRLDLTSEVGVGTTVSLHFPAERVRPAEAMPPLALASAS